VAFLQWYCVRLCPIGQWHRYPGSASGSVEQSSQVGFAFTDGGQGGQTRQTDVGNAIIANRLGIVAVARHNGAANHRALVYCHGPAGTTD